MAMGSPVWYGASLIDNYLCLQIYIYGGGESQRPFLPSCQQMLFLAFWVDGVLQNSEGCEVRGRHDFLIDYLQG